MDPDQVLAVLRKIQNFDPDGVAARDPKECLMIQACKLGMENGVVGQIIENHLPDLERHRYNEIAKGLNVSIDDIKTAMKIIGGMEPKPGRAFGGEDPHYITPDIYILKVDEEYVVVLNEDGMPRLKISAYYREILKDRDGTANETRDYIQDKLKSAQWLIRSIHQRQRTIYKVASSIVKFQKEFLDKGIAYLRPMVLRDVAEDISMHESTISRVTTNKWVHTPQGIFELKFFFKSRISSVSGEGVSSESVKDKIKKIISNENPQKPISDQAIVKILKEQEGIEIARRTVAKYREMEGILPSIKRKRPF